MFCWTLVFRVQKQIGKAGLGGDDLPHFLRYERHIGRIGEIVRKRFHAPEGEAYANGNFNDECKTARDECRPRNLCGWMLVAVKG